MTKQILRKQIEGNFEVVEYTDDGVTVSSIIKQPIAVEIDISEPQTTLEEVAEETLLETKYQTFLLEMMV